KSISALLLAFSLRARKRSTRYSLYDYTTHMDACGQFWAVFLEKYQGIFRASALANTLAGQKGALLGRLFHHKTGMMPQTVSAAFWRLPARRPAGAAAASSSSPPRPAASSAATLRPTRNPWSRSFIGTSGCSPLPASPWP